MSEPAIPAAPRARPVFARHAASLLVVREGRTGPEVLMGIRGKGHRFMPNRLVFPGGAVDPGDSRAPAASELDPAVATLLGGGARPHLARALAICAARELREETGLSLGEPPALAGLEYLCRAVTPPCMPMRFNARFLVVPAELVSGDASDTHELVSVGFRDVAAATQEDLAPVTREILLHFMEWRRDRAGRLIGSVAKRVYRGQKWALDR